MTWQGIAGRVICHGDGSFEIVGADDSKASFAFFQWHDKWIYERLERGHPEKVLTIGTDGTARMSGLWGTSKEAPALRYQLAIHPIETGVRIELEVSKTAPLSLSAGIWGAFSTPRQPGDKRMVCASPWAYQPVGKPASGPFRDLLIGIPGSTGLRLTGAAITSARSQIGKAHHGLECALRRGDFADDETVSLTIELGFGQLPEELPGEIRPSRTPLALRGTSPIPDQVACFDGIEFTVNLEGTWDNPYDPDDICLDAIVRTGNGKTYTQPGFYIIPHQRLVEGNAEVMVPDRVGEWRVRLATTELGALHCELRAKDRTGETSLELPAVTVIGGTAKGFIHTSAVDPRYLQYDDGSSFVPIGHNVPIYPDFNQLVDELVPKMTAAGENFNRWWMSERGLGIEWESKLGHYRQAKAAKMDLAIELAEKHGMTYMLCMDTHQDFRTRGWQSNPFNADNGGPCKTVQEWFTRDDVRALYRKRLRYTVARWGWSPAVLAWEFGNEFEGWADCKQSIVIDWHREMAAYLADLDPYDHLITTSWWSKTGPEDCWAIPEMDIVQTHCYTNNDHNVASQVRDYCLHQWNTFNKPHIFGEFGIRSHSSTADKDPKGWGLHNAFWAAVCSGCNGVPMPWWHESYIDPLDLYFHFTAIEKFTCDLPFGTMPWEQLSVAEVAYRNPPEKLPVTDVSLALVSAFKRRPVDTFIVQPDGSINDPRALIDLLHGEGHRDLQNPPTFQVTYPTPGDFTVRVGRVSNSGQLRIYLDDVLVTDREFPCGEGHGKSSVHRPKWDLWESVYDEDVTVPVTAGTHHIRLENLGKDWIKLGGIRFEGCKVQSHPNLLCAALKSPAIAILWLQNQKSTWFNHGNDTVAPAEAARITLAGLTDGPCTIEWWETWKGAPVRTEKAQIAGGKLVLETEAILTDIAAKIRF